MNRPKQHLHRESAPVFGKRAGCALLAAALLTALAACGGGGGSNNGGNGGPTVDPPVITTTTLPDGVVGLEYSGDANAASIVTITWSVSAGSLPAGLSLDSATGGITGTPTTAGTSTFTLQATDTQNQSDTQEYTVTIAEPTDPRVVRVTLTNDGSEANSDSGNPALNEDGRFLAFTSFADNLVAGDTNGFADVFLRDRNCGVTLRISVPSDGSEPNSQSFSPVVSAVNSGRLFVAYASDATNLVPNDTNDARDVFVAVLDVSSCSPSVINTVRASVATGNTESDGNSQLPHLSASGLRVTYTSTATNLAEADTNNQQDVFVTDLAFDGTALSVLRTRRVSLAHARVGVAIPPTTADIFSDTTIGNSELTLTPDAHIGRDVLITEGTGVNQLREIVANDATTLTVDPPWTTTPDDTSVFRIVAREEFPVEAFSDTTIGNSALAMEDDEVAGRVVEITLGTGEGQQRAVTGNDATTLTVDPAWDTLPDTSSRFRILRQGQSASQHPQLSADDRFVVFDSASQFTIDDQNSVADVFLHDLSANETTRVSLGPNGVATNGASDGPSLTPDGSLLLFRTLADELQLTLPPTPADIFSENTIGNSTLTLTPDAHVDQRVRIVEGTGAGQTGLITENTATTLTVETNWTTVPDDTSVFEILADSNVTSDLYVRELASGDLSRVTLATDGTEPNGAVDLDARMSAGGRLVVFSTVASNLVDTDRNTVRDIYLRDRQSDETRRLSLALSGSNPTTESVDPAISSDGTTVAFSSTASNFVADDTNNARDIFLVTTGVSDPAPPPSPIIVVNKLPAARRGAVYNAQLAVAGGTPPLFWSVTQGALPPGLFLDANRGRLTGVPQKAGRYRFTLSVMDAQRPIRRAQKTLTLVVSE
jgi:hypothetical protein